MVVVLEMPILELSLSNLPDPVTADVTYDVLCQVTGSQPVPEVTWKLGEIELDPEEPRSVCQQQNSPWI